MHVHIPSPSQASVARTWPSCVAPRRSWPWPWRWACSTPQFGVLPDLSCRGGAIEHRGGSGAAPDLLAAQRYRGEPYILFLALRLPGGGRPRPAAHPGYGDGRLPGSTTPTCPPSCGWRRYLQALTMLAVPFLLKRRLPGPAVVGGFGVVVAALLAAIFGRAFPAAWVEEAEPPRQDRLRVRHLGDPVGRHGAPFTSAPFSSRPCSSC